MTPVLVTGGAGYIGSHTAKLLSRAGFLPIVLDDFSTGHHWAVRWGPFIRTGIANRETVVQLIEASKISTVLHFAARTSVAESVAIPQKYYRTNVAESLEFLDAVLHAGVRRFIFSSSCAVYGVADAQRIAETHVRLPVNPYGESKLFMEKALEAYSNARGLSHVSLRYFNAAGADQEGELGEVHEPETHLIPSAIQVACGRRSRLEVCGSDYPTPDGTAIRDYTHVSDIARAHVQALHYLLDGGKSCVLNLGTGNGSSVAQVIESVQRVSGRCIRRQTSQRRAGDPPVLVADASQASNVLNWRAQKVSLDEMVRSAWAFECSGIPAARSPLSA